MPADRPLRAPLSGDRVLLRPARLGRPLGVAGGCPFCPGAEARTPPAAEQRPLGGAWRARAFPNAFPIFERHEVVVDARRHVERLHDLLREELRLAVRLWASRLRALGRGAASTLVWRNDGAGAGASVPHTHTHVAASRAAFPLVSREARAFAVACPLEDDGFWARTRPFGLVRAGEPAVQRFPGETWILPRRHAARFEDARPAVVRAFADALLAEARRLASSGLPAYNVVLHSAPRGSRRFHWHAELLPRRDGIAGVELGAGLYVNAGR